MESSTASTTHQDEPLDLSVVNHEIQEVPEDPQQMLQTFATNFAMMQSNLFTMLLQNMLALQEVQPFGISEEPPENDTKENLILPKKELMNDENDSIPSPTRRRTSTGKIDRRMIGKVCSRRVEANARERNRVQTLSKTFEQLKVCLPIEDDIKISKLATLKVACAYIGFLGAFLANNSEEEEEYWKKLQFEMESAKALRK
uniref:BHLH domain-containing protein n=1 Tax=Caenorhabditis tropicalis TaxID=1561998 RepID=A0A1I7UYE1_9PELO